MRSLLLLSLFVVAACSAPPGPGPGPDVPMPDPDPTITSFTVEKATITRGTRARLLPIFAHGTAAITPAVAGPITSGTALETAALDADTTFTLTVSAPDKSPVTATVQVHVVDAPAITSFTTSAPIITSGTSAQLTAVFSGGAGSIDQGVGLVTSGTPASTGTLTATTTFTLTVTNAAGDSLTRTVTVDVASEPRIVSFTADKTTVTRGNPVVLTGVFAGGTGVVDPGAAPITSNTPFTTPPLTQDLTFTLTVTGPVGAPKTQTVTITVVDAPVITSFTAVRPNITTGEIAQLLAAFSGGPGVVTGLGNVPGGLQPFDTAPLTQDTVFTLTVTNAANDSVTAMFTVQVHAPPQITSFTPVRPVVTVGQSSSLTAVFTGGTGSVDQNVGVVTSGVPAATAPFASSTNQTFTLTVTNPAGASVTAITAVQSVPPPQISSFNGTPRHTTLGQTVLLTGTFYSGTANIDQGVGSLSGPSFAVSTPPIQGATQFRLTVTNPAGDSVFATVDVTAVPPPVITSFTGVPSGSPDAGTTNVHLNVGQWISMTPVYTDGTGRIGPTPAPSGQLFNQTPTADTTYTLSVSNDAGMTVTANVNALIDHDVYVASDLGYVAVYRSHLDLAAAPARKIYVQNCPLPSGVAYQPISGGGLVPAFLWVTCRAQGATPARIMRIQSPQAINNTAASPATSSMTPISGAATLLNNPVSLAIDSVNGMPTVLIVSESGSATAPARGKVLVFSATVGGNVAPVRTLEPPLSGDLTTLGVLGQVALYANEIYVLSRQVAGIGTATNGVVVFPFTWSGTNVAPTRWFLPTAAGSYTNGIALSTDGIFVTTPGNVVHFPLGVSGSPSALHVVNMGPGGQAAIFDKQLVFANTEQVWGHSTVDATRKWGAQGVGFTLGNAGQVAIDPLK